MGGDCQPRDERSDSIQGLQKVCRTGGMEICEDAPATVQLGYFVSTYDIRSNGSSY